MEIISTINPEQYYCIRSAAQKLNVHRTTVYNWINQGLIEVYCTNIKKIKGCDLISFMKKYYSAERAAQKLNVNRVTLYRWIKKGVIETEVQPGKNTKKIKRETILEFSKSLNNNKNH
jgi:excisionase family DNA binding protein